jgi:hypothetical protein
MPTPDVEDIFERIKTMAPSDQLLLASGLCSRARELGNTSEGRSLLEIAGKISGFVKRDIDLFLHLHASER